MTRCAATAAVESAAQWERLADEADRMGDYERSRGHYDGVERNKARSYRDAAKSCRLEAATGVPHCSCCFKPLGGKR